MAGRPMHAGEEVVAVMGGALARATQKTGPRGARRRTSARCRRSRVVFEDDDIVVVDKPSGLLTAPTPESDRNNLADCWRGGQATGPVLVVHRIDLETSGLVVFAKTADANRELSRSFSRPRPGAGLPGRRSSGASPTRLKLIDRARGRAPRGHARGDPGTVRRPARRWSRVGWRPDGRTRSGCTWSRSEHPVIGDARYGRPFAPPPPRMALHATKLGLAHPRRARRCRSRAPGPPIWKPGSPKQCGATAVNAVASTAAFSRRARGAKVL